MIELEIYAAALAALRASTPDLQVVDVREDWEAAIARLDGAFHIPMGQMAARFQELDPRKPVVVYCHHGIRSLNVALALRSRGFADGRSLRGGIDRWSMEIDPGLPRY